MEKADSRPEKRSWLDKARLGSCWPISTATVRWTVAVANSGDNTATILLNDGTGSFTPSTTFSVIKAPATLAATHLDGDGNLDLVVVNSGGASVSLFRGDGHGNFAPSGAYLTGRSPISIALADLDGDGIADVITANQAGQTLSLMLVRH
jgi:large repetitive protein